MHLNHVLFEAKSNWVTRISFLKRIVDEYINSIRCEYYMFIIQPKMFNNKWHFMCIYFDIIENHNAITLFYSQILHNN
jgi:hypothetical protein